MRIAFALRVRRGKVSVVPRRSQALDWIFPVIRQIIPENSSPQWIGSGDVRAPVDQSMRLIEVHGLHNVVRNHAVVLPEFGNTIHLHGQQYRDAVAMQLTCEKYYRGASPTVAEQHNAGT